MMQILQGRKTVAILVLIYKGKGLAAMLQADSGI